MKTHWQRPAFNWRASDENDISFLFLCVCCGHQQWLISTIHFCLHGMQKAKAANTNGAFVGGCHHHCDGVRPATSSKNWYYYDVCFSWAKCYILSGAIELLIGQCMNEMPWQRRRKELRWNGSQQCENGETASQSLLLLNNSNSGAIWTPNGSGPLQIEYYVAAVRLVDTANGLLMLVHAPVGRSTWSICPAPSHQVADGEQWLLSGKHLVSNHINIYKRQACHISSKYQCQQNYSKKYA